MNAKDNKKWAINNLTYLARNFKLLKAHFFCPCAFIYKKYFSYSLIFSYSLLHEAALCRLLVRISLGANFF